MHEKVRVALEINNFRTLNEAQLHSTKHERCSRRVGDMRWRELLQWLRLEIWLIAGNYMFKHVI